MSIHFPASDAVSGTAPLPLTGLMRRAVAAFAVLAVLASPCAWDTDPRQAHEATVGHVLGKSPQPISSNSPR